MGCTPYSSSRPECTSRCPRDLPCLKEYKARIGKAGREASRVAAGASGRRPPKTTTNSGAARARAGGHFYFYFKVASRTPKRCRRTTLYNSNTPAD
eukprot:scaffold22119_cov83-Isochrysis_galbana.AAC.1